MPIPEVKTEVRGPALGVSAGRKDPKTGLTYFAGGNFEEQKTQMKPILDLITSGTYRDVPGGLLDAYVKGQKSLEETVSAIKGTPVFNPNQKPTYDFGGGVKVTQDKFRGANELGGGFDIMPEIRKLAAERGQNLDTATGAPAPVIPGGFKTPDELQSAVENVSTDTKGAGVDTRGKSLSQIISEALNTSGGAKPDVPYPELGARPEAPSGETLTGLNQQYGIEGLQSQLAAIDQQIQTIMGEAADKIAAGGVSSRVLAKESAMLNKQISALRSERTMIQRDLTQATKAVNMVMSSMKTDYANALREWTFEFNQNQKAITAFERDVKTTGTQAKTHLQTIQNLITQGKVKITDLSDDQKLQIEEWEQEAYGSAFVGMTEQLKPKPKVYSTRFTGPDGTNYVQNLSVNPDGSVESEYVTPVAGGEQKVVEQFDKKLTAFTGKTTREQFIRELQAQFPQIDPADISSKVYETFPDFWEKGGTSKKGKSFQ